ncbi:MAG TPA: glycosyltransferase family 4 protein [Chthonomonadaceae bacterium]|nr:glycosyltransferase family 4 protein [Chthonomonadaceae bacterium]
MKTLVITNLYPSARQPTRGMYNVSMVCALARHTDVRLIAPLPWWSRLRQPAELFVAPRESATGIDACFPTYWSFPGRQSMHGEAMYRSLRARVRAIRREFPFDAILAAWAYPDAYAAGRLAAEFRCPLVTNVLGSDVNAFGSRPGIAHLVRQALGWSHSVVAVSDALKERIVALGIAPERVVVQHNGVDGAVFTLQDRLARRRSLGLPEHRKIVLYVGNWVEEKGVDVLVEAAGRLARTGSRDMLVALVGGGPREPAMRSAVERLGISDLVLFAGRKPHSEIPDWMAASDLFCLPSLREGCPNVVLESLSCGRPVVASRVGGIPELLDDEKGIMPPPGDPDALAAAIVDTLSRDWSAEALRESVRDKSWETVGRVYYEALAGAVASRS